MCGKHEATIHLTEIVNDKMVELHICETCAKEKSVELTPPMAFNDILSGLVDFTGGKSPEKNNSVCPECTMTFEEFRDSGRLGCAACYESFKDELTPLIKNVQGVTHHIGKRPSEMDEVLQVKMELKELSAKLKKLIANEEFEEAVQVRDKIRMLEARMKPQGGDEAKGKESKK
jgi:protein arginine kinase activator